MRVIAGQFRGRKLLAPASDVTRPITDRVKQSVFDILAPIIADAAVYDCFAGTGSMGLECLSRGAARVTFFETDRSAIALLKRNIQALQMANRTRLITGDLFRWFAGQPQAAVKNVCATLVFLDPPYRFLRERPDDLRMLAGNLAARHLAPDALVVFRHDAGDSLDLPPLNVIDVRRYGGMTVEFLSPAKNETGGP